MKHVIFNFDETVAGDFNDQLATALRVIGDVRECDGAIVWISDRNGDPGHYVEYQIVPENEFSIYVSDWCRDNDNPEPADAEIEAEKGNYHTVVINGSEHVLVPQL